MARIDARHLCLASSVRASFTDVFKGRGVCGVDCKAESVADGVRRRTPIVECGPAFDVHDVKAFAPYDIESTSALPARNGRELLLRGPSIMTAIGASPSSRAEAGVSLSAG